MHESSKNDLVLPKRLLEGMPRADHTSRIVHDTGSHTPAHTEHTHLDSSQTLFVEQNGPRSDHREVASHKTEQEQENKFWTTKSRVTREDRVAASKPDTTTALCSTATVRNRTCERSAEHITRRASRQSTSHWSQPYRLEVGVRSPLENWHCLPLTCVQCIWLCAACFPVC